MSEDVPEGWFVRPTLDPRRADALRRSAVRGARRPATWLPEATLAAAFSALLVAWALHAVWAGGAAG